MHFGCVVLLLVLTAGLAFAGGASEPVASGTTSSSIAASPASGYDMGPPRQQVPLSVLFTGGYAKGEYAGEEFEAHLEEATGSESIDADGIRFGATYLLASRGLNNSLEFGFGVEGQHGAGGGVEYESGSSWVVEGWQISYPFSARAAIEMGPGRLFLGGGVSAGMVLGTKRLFYESRLDDDPDEEDVDISFMDIRPIFQGGYRLELGGLLLGVTAEYATGPFGGVELEPEMTYGGEAIVFQELLNPRFVISLSLGARVQGGEVDQGSPLAVSPEFGVITTEGVQIEAQDGSFRYVSGERFTPFGVFDTYGHSLHNKSSTVKERWRLALELGATPVLVSTPYREEPLHGLLLFHRIDRRAGGAVSRSYNIRIPERYVQEATGGRMSVVYEPYSVPGVGDDARPMAWTLWLSDLPIASGGVAGE